MMYVLHVKTLEEENICKELRRKGYKAYVPRQEKIQRKEGEWFEAVELLFNSYVFVDVDLPCSFSAKTGRVSELEPKIYKDIKSTSGVINFLVYAGSNSPEPLSDNDKEFIDYLTNGSVKNTTNKCDQRSFSRSENSEVLRPISVSFKNGKMKILDDEFKYCEKDIVSVSRRQKRIKVLLDFAGTKKEVTLYIKELDEQEASP